jgi:signal transduction histidine kinase
VADAPITRPKAPLPPSSDERRLAEFTFLHDIAQVATLARDWDELMRTIVDGATVAMGVEVCSFYLADRERTRVTLAATNGLDRSQVGKVSLAWGSGITGRVAATRQPIAVEDVTKDERFSWVRGFDIEALAGMLSVPLVWHDDVVGVLNVQTRGVHRFDDAEIAFLQTIAALLAGIVEKGRLTAEIEGRLEQLTALDAARAELLSVVTHELRTPLSIVRVYVDLLADAAIAGGAAPAAEDWRTAADDQLLRLDRLVDSILASVRTAPDEPASVGAVDLSEIVGATVEPLAPILRQHRVEIRPGRRLQVLADPPRLRQILEHLIENAVKYAPPRSAIAIDWSLVEGVVRLGVTDEGPGIPAEWRERIFEPYTRRDTRTARGSGIGLYAAKRLAESMSARLWCEPVEPHGARFVLAMPAAVAL